ncbi:MAG TPA: PAS domain S-box protein [Bacteroidales bacterium]|nr:PAS domain S-box protein [Bacteroidales bacterium]
MIMFKPNKGIPELLPIQSKVLNSLLLYMSIGAMPLLATSLFLIITAGWKISMVTDTIGLLSVPVIYLFRNRISYNFKTSFLVIAGYLTGILVLHDYSFFGTGLIILCAVTLTSALFFGMRTGWILMISNVVGIAIIGVLYHYNFIVYNFDFATYIYSPFTWLDHSVTFLFFIGVVVITSGNLHSALVALLSQTRTEKEKFKGLFNNIQDGILIYSTDGKILEMNNSLLDMYGISRSSVFVNKLEDFSIMERNGLPEGIEDEVKWQYEAKAKRFDNQDEFYIEVMLSPIEYGEQEAVLANIRNITQRRENEEALRQSEEKYRSLIESSPAAIFIIESDRFLYINPAGAKSLGYTVDELIGRDMYSLLAPGFLDKSKKRVTRAIGNRENPPVEFKFRKADGTYIWAETVSIPFAYYGSNSVLIMGFDITERKKAEELILQKNIEIEKRNFEYALLNKQLKKAKEKAEESDRLKSAFLSNMSHEIRTPMNAILGFSDLLIKASLTEKKKAEYIGIINSSGNQLLSLINDIIDISKIESNQIVIDYSSQLNLLDLFKHLFILFDSKARGRQIRLEYNVELDDKQCTVYLDEIRLKQVLSNLIGNALKFTHDGFIRFNVALENGELLFSVEDSGIGIESHQQAIIFERFRQADGSTTRDYGGTGLGLSISKALVELMGGKIWLSSVYGKGTTFYFTLPYHSIEPKHREPIHEDGDYAKDRSWTGKTILLVEDEEVNIYFLQELLEPTGVTLLVARNASEAYALLASTPKINLILLDIKIQEVDGYEIAKVIKRSHPDVPIVAQTAYALAEERKKILESRFDDYISKPINNNIMFNVLSRYLGKHSDEQ